MDVVYVGVFLSTDSREKLLYLVAPAHEAVFAHHVTVQFKPTAEQLAQYKVPERVEFQAIGMVADERGQAVLVRGVSSANENPHITISCAKGTKPAYSNELFKKAEITLFAKPINLVGTLDTFPSFK